MYVCFLLFKQKTAYEMRISDWSSDVCSSDLLGPADQVLAGGWQPATHRADVTGGNQSGPSDVFQVHSGRSTRAAAALPASTSTASSATTGTEAKIRRDRCRERVCRYC